MEVDEDDDDDDRGSLKPTAAAISETIDTLSWCTYSCLFAAKGADEIRCHLKTLNELTHILE